MKQTLPRIFRYLLDDEDAEVRVHAINGLWEDEDATLVRHFIGALRSDPDASVRAAAAEALGRFLLLAETKRISGADGDEIQTALLATIRNIGEDRLVHRRAIEAIAYIGDETVRNLVTVAYADDDSKMRASGDFRHGTQRRPILEAHCRAGVLFPRPANSIRGGAGDWRTRIQSRCSPVGRIDSG